MKKNVMTIIAAVVLCLAMLTACGGNAADDAYKDWADNEFPRVEEANADLKAKGEEATASGDREAAIAATLEFRDIIEEVTNGLAAIDLSEASDDVKTAAEAQLADLQAQLDALNATLENAGISEDSGEISEDSSEEAEEYSEEVPEDYEEEVPEDSSEEVTEEE